MSKSVAEKHSLPHQAQVLNKNEFGIHNRAAKWRVAVKVYYLTKAQKVCRPRNREWGHARAAKEFLSATAWMRDRVTYWAHVLLLSLVPLSRAMGGLSIARDATVQCMHSALYGTYKMLYLAAADALCTWRFLLLQRWTGASRSFPQINTYTNRMHIHHRASNRANPVSKLKKAMPHV